MNDRQIRYAHTVWRERSFSKASERLRVSQPSLSDQVRLLEDELGFDLFRRSNRGVEPTAPGATFLAEAARVVSGLDDLKDFAIDLHGRPGTQLRIGIAPCLAPVLAPVVAIRARSSPSLRLSIANAGTRRVHRMVGQGRLDLGVTLQDAVGRVRAGLAVEELRSLPLVVICAATDAPQRPMSLAELAGRALIVSDTSVGYGPLLMTLFAGQDPKFRVTAYCDDLAAIRRMVRAGLGVAVVPALALDGTVADPATAVRPLEAGAAIRVHLVRGAERPPPRIESQIAAAAAAIRERLGAIDDGGAA